MFTDAYKTMLRKVASDYDAASQELFAIARRIEGSDRYNPENELYSLVRVAEANTVQLRTLAARVMGQPNMALNEDYALFRVKTYGEKKRKNLRYLLPELRRLLPDGDCVQICNGKG